LLYYIAVFTSTHMEALKKGLKGLNKDEVPQLLPTLRRGFHFTIPIILLIITLVKGFTPFRAAFIAIIALIVVAMFRKESRLTPRSFVDTLVLGAKNSIVIAASCGCAGIVVGVLDVTGLGIKFVTIVTELSGGLLPVALVLVMISCLVLGMGVPTAPAYIIAAMIAAPTLVHFGIQPIVAHMFIFYSALLSAITPPVALAAYAAAAISGGRVMVTGIIASRLGIVVFLVPYIFVYDPALLMIGSPLFVMWAFLTGVIGTLNLVFALGGYLFSRLSWWQRIIFLIAGLSAIVPQITTDIIGLGLFVVFGWMNYRQSREVATVS
jgi:TRAP transporter 4TM/12TM fusion protein